MRLFIHSETLFGAFTRVATQACSPGNKQFNKSFTEKIKFNHPDCGSSPQLHECDLTLWRGCKETSLYTTPLLK